MSSLREKLASLSTYRRPLYMSQREIDYYFPNGAPPHVRLRASEYPAARFGRDPTYQGDED